MSDASASIDRLWRDPRFLLALAAGPAVWILLSHWNTDARTWPLHLPAGYARNTLLYPVLEEIAFRGVLQPGLDRYSWARRAVLGISVANALVSVMFAASHLFAHPPLWAAAVFLPSLLFGYFRDRYRHLLPAVLLHVLYNAGYFLWFG